MGQKFFYGWWIVIAAFICLFVAYGTRFYSFGVFFKPMMESLGWNRTMTAGAVSLSTLLYGLLSPVVGKLIDKYGPRKIMLAGAFVGGLGFFLINFTTKLWHFYLFYSVIMTIGICCIALIPNNTVVTNWFQKKRSLAMGIIATGIGLGGFVMTIVARYIIAAVGWRVSFVVWGLLVWIVIIPTVAFLIKARPEDMGLLPDGEAIERVDEGAHASSHSKEENASSQSNTHKTWTINSALGTLNFWLIAFAFFFSGAGFMAILIHLVPHVTDIGISETQAATALGLLTLISVPGRLFGGYIGDKIDKRYAIIIALGGQALTVLLFLVIFNIGNLGILYVFVVLFGFTLGMNSPLIPATIAEIYGAVSFGLIYGAVMLLGTFGTALGPVLCGYMFDTMNSYFFAFVCMTGMIFLGALCVVFLRLPEQQDA